MVKMANRIQRINNIVVLEDEATAKRAERILKELLFWVSEEYEPEYQGNLYNHKIMQMSYGLLQVEEERDKLLAEVKELKEKTELLLGLLLEHRKESVEE